MPFGHGTVVANRDAIATRLSIVEQWCNASSGDALSIQPNRRAALDAFLPAPKQAGTQAACTPACIQTGAPSKTDLTFNP